MDPPTTCCDEISFVLISLFWNMKFISPSVSVSSYSSAVVGVAGIHRFGDWYKGGLCWAWLLFAVPRYIFLVKWVRLPRKYRDGAHREDLTLRNSEAGPGVSIYFCRSMIGILRWTEIQCSFATNCTFQSLIRFNNSMHNVLGPKGTFFELKKIITKGKIFSLAGWLVGHISNHDISFRNSSIFMILVLGICVLNSRLVCCTRFHHQRLRWRVFTEDFTCNPFL